MNERLKGKNVIITGASSGIGERIAYLVAEQGATPILLARRYDQLASIAEAIKNRYNNDCFFYQVDVSDTKSVLAVFTEILDRFQTIDVLVNNAGFGVFENVVDANLDRMKSMFEVNVFGLIACTKMVLPRMIEQNSGHVINIASQAGKIATPKSSVYSATKHAVLGFTNSLRLELMETNIHVTAVNPGPIRTRFFDIADESGNYAKNVDKFMLDPDKVAWKIVKAMLTSKRELNLPGWMNAGSVFYTLFPRLVEKVGGKAFFKK
ncbi:SDR family NAD(P)-dependent oxidoreductase [Ferdinandcohnia quinoae]|uniref:SDR family oxidoreductase n=1 Tax=Fredinandcohnia quinoae TaxID=2918902 RepID=A0AAW5DWZ2_9BACI|nr:SDR family oxidoreductase [Fredinandcohnia sp. SECRCQ15]MCH1624863.1 SDR family oxidoreductase [Fredinandcohnia sp. SECRCQ15]